MRRCVLGGVLGAREVVIVVKAGCDCLLGCSLGVVVGTS